MLAFVRSILILFYLVMFWDILGLGGFGSRDFKRRQVSAVHWALWLCDRKPFVLAMANPRSPSLASSHAPTLVLPLHAATAPRILVADPSDPVTPEVVRRTVRSENPTPTDMKTRFVPVELVEESQTPTMMAKGVEETVKEVGSAALVALPAEDAG